jgi:Legionella pneumophila major outer membrane protein precursor
LVLKSVGFIFWNAGQGGDNLMSRFQLAIAARWCRSRYGVAILLALPACSLQAASPTGQTAGPFRASQVMPVRAQLPPPQAANGAANGAAIDPNSVIEAGQPPVDGMYPVDSAYPGAHPGFYGGPYPDGAYGPYPGHAPQGGYHSGRYGHDPNCCDGRYAIDCAEGATDCCYPKFSWHLDWLYLQPSGVDLAHAQQQNGIGGAGTVPFGDIGTLDTDYDSGARIGFSVACGPCSAVEWSYTYFESDADSFLDPPVIPGGGGAVGSLVHHPGAAITASAGPVDAFYEIDFQLSDLLYRGSLTSSSCHSVSYLLGVQYGNLEQSFLQLGVFSGGSAGLIDTSSTIDFDGGGLKAGIDAERRIRGGLSIYSRLTGAVMSGQFSSRYTMLNSTTDVLLAQVNWKDDRVVSHLEYEIGFGWMSASEHWRFSSGYLFSHWMNAVTMPAFIDAVQADNYSDVEDTISFDGLVTRVEARW